MIQNEPLIKYGHIIILSCIILYIGLSNYLEYLFYRENENEDF